MRRSVNKITSMVLVVLILTGVMSLFTVSVSAGEATLIDKLTATVTEPVAGEVPDFTFTNEVENATITQIIWWRIEEDNSGTSVKPDEKFVEGQLYECDVRFQVSDDSVRFTENVSGTVNGKSVESYTNGAGTVCTLYAYFTCESADDNLSVIFTEDSKAQCNGSLTVDLEAMAELSEKFMEAYINFSFDCCWYVDGVALVEYTDHNLDITEEYCGKSVYVDVFYGSEKVTSETLAIAHYEAPHVCEYDFENPVEDTATCENDGVYVYKCIDTNCDNTSTKPSPAKGHDFSEWEETVEADCKNNGEKQRFCYTCSETETETILAYGSHTDDDEDKICDVCGDQLENYKPSIPSSDDEATKDESSADEATKDEATKDEDKPVDPSEPSTPDENDPTNPVDKGILGDVNGDGKVNIKDATLIQKFAAKLMELTDAEKIRADVNADAKVNVKDATAIQKYVAKMETGFEIGKPIA